VALIEATHPEYDLEGNHWELANIWRDIESDRNVRSAVYTWAVPPSSPGRDHMPEHIIPWNPKLDPDERAKSLAAWLQLMKEARDTINNLLDCSKVVISAIRGRPTYGSSLQAAILADISIAADDVVIEDRHVETAVAAGDGIMFWSLLCGVQKAKLLALTGDPISGREAERIGLVSVAVPDDEVMATAMRYARRFADGPQNAAHFTKRSMNLWLKLASVTSFETALASEILQFFGDPDVAVLRSTPGFRGQGQSRNEEFVQPELPSVRNPWGPIK
jgi:enoyl-CoA hydratase